MTLLDDIERHERKKIRFRAFVHRSSNPGTAFLVSFLVAPFLILEFIFVPFFGQAIVGLGFLLSLRYLWVKKSLAMLLAGIIGAGASLTILSVNAKYFQSSGAPIFYFLLTFATFVAISYLIFIAGALWMHYQKGVLPRA